MDSTQEIICFQKAYYTNEGLEIAKTAPKNSLITAETGQPQINYVVHIQNIDGARIFAVVDHTTGWYKPAESYSRETVLANLLAGKLSIGFISKFLHEPRNVVKHIFRLFDCDEYLELRLHYTDKNRTNPRNVAWRNMSWDLFGVCGESK
jgi:hypothetical protein